MNQALQPAAQQYYNRVVPTTTARFKFKPFANPILLLNDAPDLMGGLSRIGRDIASLLATMPEFRVGYLGRGGVGTTKFSWMQYSFPTTGQWGEEYIENVWNDFSRGEPGIIMSLWDASRMLWFHDGNATNSRLARFLGDGRNYLKWGYFPVDSVCLNGKLGTEMSAAISGYDRVLAASEWGAGVLRETLSSDAPEWIPHGYWPDKFYPADDDQLINHNGVMVGCVMANQSRKDWPTVFKCANMLRYTYGSKLTLWCHTDTKIGYWNLLALAADLNLMDCVYITHDLSDASLRQHYSSCATTMLPTRGEGFGYPILESQACGTPCVTTDYAAGQEIVDDQYKVNVPYYFMDGPYNLNRAVNNAEYFYAKMLYAINLKTDHPIEARTTLTDRVRHLRWEYLAHVWKRWFISGLKERM